MKRYQFPKDAQSRNEMKPYQQKVFMINADKHRVNAMSNRQLIIMRPDSKLKERIRIDIAYVNLCLVVINKINF